MRVRNGLVAESGAPLYQWRGLAASKGEMMADPVPARPPRARIAFRVGVVGHRPDRLPTSEAGRTAIERQVCAVLEAVRHAVTEFSGTDEAKLYADAPPLLRAVSPLAEGADRTFAAAALDQGYELCVPMPFARAEYEKDFASPGSVDAFHGLIDRARRETALTIFELHQTRVVDEDDVGIPYGAAGRLVVNQSDLLIAIWDGDKARGKGGTVATMREAVGFRVPVLRIDAREPYGFSLIQSNDNIDSCIRSRCIAHALDAAELRVTISEIVRGEIALPRTRIEPKQPSRLSRLFGFLKRSKPTSPHRDQLESAEARRHANNYFDEKHPRINIGFWWKLFRDVIGGVRPGKPRIWVEDFVKGVRKQWPAEPNDPSHTKMAGWVNARLRTHYAWADGLADHYADAHRSGFLWTSLLAATAVFLALAPIVQFGFPIPEAHSGVEAIYILLEALTLGLLFTIILRGRIRRWHERWLEYRMLAEWVRQLRFVIPMGGARPLMRTPAHLAVYGDPQHSWAYWHVRAIARETGIPNAEADSDYVSDCLDFLARTVGDQFGFHAKSKDRSERIHHWLHFATAVLVGFTIASVVFHLAITLRPQLPHLLFGLSPYGALLIFSAGFPALSAALANIDNQGEFARLSKRSRSMADAFKLYRKEVKGLTDRLTNGAPPTMAEVTLLASRVATSMVEEVVDWRIVAIDLPHEPG
jgi:hypothetical protein